MFGIVAQNCFRNRCFQVVNFNAQQVLDEWLRDVLVAENEPEHNRVCNVKIVKSFDAGRIAFCLVMNSPNYGEAYKNG